MVMEISTDDKDVEPIMIAMNIDGSAIRSNERSRGVQVRRPYGKMGSQGSPSLEQAAPGFALSRWK